MSEDLFAGFSRFGDRILHGIDQQERPALKYKAMLGQINNLLKSTHGMVFRRLERIEMAEETSEAHTALDELNHEVLEESFRLEGMCDLFNSLGQGLMDLTYYSENKGDFSGADLQEVREFAMRLIDREDEVASVYTQLIRETVNLEGLDPDDLPALKQQAKAVKQVLTEQMADFHAKSQRFTRLSS